MTPLGLRDRFEDLGRHKSFLALLAVLRQRKPVLQQLSGLASAARAAYLLLLQRKTGRPVLVLTGSQAAAETLHETLQAWFEMAGGSETDPAPCLLPAHDVTPFDGLSPHPDICESRAIALWRMAERQVSIVVAPVAAALQRVAAPDRYRELAWPIEAGDRIDLEELAASLGTLGYRRREPVEMVGQFAVRAGSWTCSRRKRGTRSAWNSSEIRWSRSGNSILGRSSRSSDATRSRCCRCTSTRQAGPARASCLPDGSSAPSGRNGAPEACSTCCRTRPSCGSSRPRPARKLPSCVRRLEDACGARRRRPPRALPGPGPLDARDPLPATGVVQRAGTGC